MTTTLDTPHTPHTLHTCDRCGALAHTRFVLPSGRDLELCGHHAREYAPGLRKADAVAVATQPELLAATA